MKRRIVYLFILQIVIGIHSSLFCQNAPIVLNYSFEPAVQHFVVPPGVGTITVTIAGARGAGALGGKGANFTAICNVIENHILSVVVGQMGTASADTGIHSGGGGGGASWLYDSNSVLYNPNGTMGLLAVAAGGGGAASAWHNPPNPGWRYYSGLDAGVDLSTNAATTDSNCEAGGTEGNGGSESGGAGWLSNGGGGTCLSGMDEANHFSASLVAFKLFKEDLEEVEGVAFSMEQELIAPGAVAAVGIMAAAAVLAAVAVAHT